MIYIAIVDDKKDIRTTLAKKLNNIEGYEVLFTAENGKDFLRNMTKAQKAIEPDIVLMDIDMPIMNGIEAVAESKFRFLKTRYLMLTIFDEDEKIFNAIKAGADGYLLKDEPVEKIKEAIDSLMNGESAPMSPSIARKVFNLLNCTQQNLNKPEKQQPDSCRSENEYKLTDRETSILTLLMDGLEYKQIAQKLNLSPYTVRNNVTRIYNKLHVTSRMQAAKVMGKI